MIVIAARSTEPRSNFFVDQAALASAVGAVSLRVDLGGRPPSTTPRGGTGGRDRAAHGAAQPASRTCRRKRCPTRRADVDRSRPRAPTQPSTAGRRRPAPTARRVPPPGVRRRSWRRGRLRETRWRLSAEQCGALLATSRRRQRPLPRQPVVTRRLRRLRLAARRRADLRRRPHRRLGLRAEHVDDAARHPDRTRSHGRPGRPDDPMRSARTGRSTSAWSATSPQQQRALADARARTDQRATGPTTLRRRIARELRWRDVPYDDRDSWTDRPADPDDRPRRPAARRARRGASTRATSWATRACSSSVPDEDGFCFTQAFQSIGLGLATTIGAALARPDRLPSLRSATAAR